MKMERAWIDERAAGAVQGLFVVEGFAHAHEDKVSQAATFRRNQGTGLHNLIQNFRHA